MVAPRVTFTRRRARPSSPHLPLLYPGDPAECLNLGRHAIALSRLTGLWSALKIVADVADATATVDLHPNSISPILPRVQGREYEHFPNGNLMTPRTIDVEQEIYEIRYQLARDYASENKLNLVTVDPGCRVCRAASGNLRSIRRLVEPVGTSIATRNAAWSR